MSNSLLLSFLCIFMNITVTMGQRSELCASSEIYKQQLLTDSEFKEKIEEGELQWQQYLSRKQNTAQRLIVTGTDTIYEIPVVVHVVDTGGAIGTNYNRTDADIINWIDYLNKVYAAQWSTFPDTSNGGTRVPIRFSLAKLDPNCNPTNGIVRVNAGAVPEYKEFGIARNDILGASEEDIKALSRWPPQSYYNIYIINKFDGKDGYVSSGSFIAGYAYYAGTSPAKDGSFMISYVANSNSQTLPHEMGHAMGLYHTFDGAADYPDCALEANCVTDGDFVCDTEHSPNNLGNNPCPTNSDINPCTTVQYNSIQYNFMNYGSCRDRFTKGQADRAIQQLKMFRQSLVSSGGLDTASVSAVTVAQACEVSINKDATNTSNIGPSNITFNEINYYSQGYSGDGSTAYVNHIASSCYEGGTTTKLIAGQTYDLKVSTTLNSQRMKAYIDYNNDGVFNTTAPELVLYVDNAAAGATQTAAVTVPSSATLNTPIRLRVMSDTRSSTAGAFNYGPCDTMRRGQVEDFYVTIANDISLPIVLREFKIISNKCDARLQWQFDNTDILEKLELETSIDGIHFINLTEIKNKFETGFYDNIETNEPVRYFRLKWHETDGYIGYSNVEKLSLNCNRSVKIYPNPFENDLKIEISTSNADNVLLTVKDILGREVWRNTKKLFIGNNLISINLGKLQNYVYLLSIQGNNINEQQLIIKNTQK